MVTYVDTTVAYPIPFVSVERNLAWGGGCYTSIYIAIVFYVTHIVFFILLLSHIKKFLGQLCDFTM